MSLFQKKYRIESIRLQNRDYGLPGIYFITICTKNHVKWFGQVIKGKMILSNIGKYVREEWIKTEQIRPEVKLDSFIFMPDHMHGIIIIKNDDKLSHILAHHVVETHGDASLQRYDESRVSYKNKFGPQRRNLSSIIRGYKSKTTKIIRQNYNANFNWQARFTIELLPIDNN